MESKNLIPLDKLTEKDIVLYFWIESTDFLELAIPLVYRGRRRTMDESIMLCGGDVKKYMQYLKDDNV